MLPRLASPALPPSAGSSSHQRPPPILVDTSESDISQDSEGEGCEDKENDARRAFERRGPLGPSMMEGSGDEQGLRRSASSSQRHTASAEGTVPRSNSRILALATPPLESRSLPSTKDRTSCPLPPSSGGGSVRSRQSGSERRPKNGGSAVGTPSGSRPSSSGELDARTSDELNAMLATNLSRKNDLNEQLIDYHDGKAPSGTDVEWLKASRSVVSMPEAR
ncbi:hypothetical protein BCV69DRAFT_25666 [Microstroma glucosiphilum]|uniref:Uncharacterized protein n=1 Tax=Pseudomicrostroma glucosiphilum TaxID=1684307 RepID=A0A316UGD8_9BASI|nr:hypothetical protein BCV69DRAFT_25666 [Pseudomicrostroma glucosiphilum]PWN24309.1 hypothetical protein BCV69DRAFT_25666 [Pseudomicrostroma glucosiphilum]